MKLHVQKRLAASILKCSPKKVWIDPNSLTDVKEAITKIDIKSLIQKGIIRKKPDVGVSKFRARKIKIQKRKGKQKGPGSRKGKETARLKRKDAWMSRVRLQRKFLKKIKDKKLVDLKTFRELYSKSKGGFFRSKRHIKLYLEEHNLVGKK